MTTPPSHLSRSQVLGTVLCALAFVWLCLPIVDATLLAPQWDEFIRLTNARRVFMGERPWVDYVEHTGTGADLLYAGLFFVVGGANAGAARLFTLILVAAGSSAGFLYLRARRVSTSVAVVACALFPLVLFQIWPVPHHHWLSAVFGVFAIAVAPRVPVVAGLLLGFSLLCTQSAGVVACAAGAASLVFAVDPRRTALRVGVGVGVITALLAAYIVANGAWGKFVDFALVFPLSGYVAPGGPNDITFSWELSERMALVWQADHSLLLKLLATGALLAATWAPAFLVAVAVFLVVTRARRSPLSALALVGLLVTCWIGFRPRPDVFHGAVVAILPALVLPLFVQDSPRLRVLFTAVVGAACALGLVSLVVNRALAQRPPSVFAKVDSTDRALAGLSEADALMVSQDRRLSRVRRFLVEHPDARLFAAPVGAAANFFGPRPAAPLTLVYDPTVPYLRDADYGLIADALELRPADLVMLTTREAEAAFLHPPSFRGRDVERLAALLRDGYVEAGRDGSTVFFVPVQPER
ncbi:MAG: hypothetical protein Q8O67_18165 [Deltaproteobacteria bacterium]|nr:hypothetical protein [Deltaproteobacteria bacterium]